MMPIAVTWPAWLAWLLAIAILVTLWLAWAMARRVGRMSEALRSAGIGGNLGGFRSRREVEEAYTAGSITRDTYERLKGRLS